MSTIQLINLDGKNWNSASGGNTNYNIVEDYPWTITPSKQRINVPVIELIEFEQDVSTLYASLNYWYTQAAKSKTLSESDNPYQGLYSAKETKARFIFPYFEEYDHNVSQTWDVSKGLLEGEIAGTIATTIQNVQKAMQKAPGSNINQQRIWQGSAPATYTFNFHLFNTIGGTANDNKQIKANMVLRNRLLMSALHDQQTATMISPPALFTVKIPGIRYSPAAVISNMVVSNVGQMNQISLDGVAKIVPDAYKFAITITELIVESRQLLDAAVNNRRIMAIDSSNRVASTLAEVGHAGQAATFEVKTMLGIKTE
jgi:hypothetical protein